MKTAHRSPSTLVWGRARRGAARPGPRQPYRSAAASTGLGWRQERAGSSQALADEGEGELLEVTAGGIRDVAQGTLPREDRQPRHRGPDGGLRALPGPPAEPRRR